MEMKDIYNDKDNIRKYVIDLDTLHEVMKARNEAYYTFGLILNSMTIINDFIYLDNCGNTMIQLKNGNYTMSRIPKSTDKCPYCGNSWDLNNIDDFVLDYNHQTKVETFRHKFCNLIEHLESQKSEFIDIFSRVYDISTLKFKPIPNQYCQCNKCSPWFIVSTPDGDIKIGWRKHVINISWLDNYTKFSATFEDEDVTKWFREDVRGIHAWSIEKCVEYLQLAKDSKISPEANV